MRDITNPKVPWSPRGAQYTEAEIDAVVDVMRNAETLTQGPYQAKFETAFKDLCGAHAAFAVTSCTAALELAALLCRLEPGDEVILPAHTFAASAIPFARTGAHLVWVDIEPDTLVVSADAIAPLITEKTKVIIVVHLYGLMADMEPIMALAKKHNLRVVEDAAQAVGATYRGRHAGSIGDLGCFSFHTHKTMSTLGEGGMLTVNDPDLADVVPGLRHNGMRGFEGTREAYWKPAMSNVDFDWDGVWPYNFCMGEVQCAVGLMQLDRIPEMTARRQERAHRMIAACSGFPELTFQRTPQDRDNVYYCLPARYDGAAIGKSRDDFMNRMAFHHGVKMVVQYYPLNRYPMFEKAGFGVGNVPSTEAFFDAMVSFPFHEWMPDDQFDYLVDATVETLKYLRT